MEEGDIHTVFKNVRKLFQLATLHKVAGFIESPRNCRRVPGMINWNSKGILSLRLIQPAKHIRRRKGVEWLMSDIESGCVAGPDEGIVANIACAACCRGAHFVDLLNIAMIVGVTFAL